MGYFGCNILTFWGLLKTSWIIGLFWVLFGGYTFRFGCFLNLEHGCSATYTQLTCILISLFWRNIVYCEGSFSALGCNLKLLYLSLCNLNTRLEPFHFSLWIGYFADKFNCSFWDCSDWLKLLSEVKFWYCKGVLHLKSEYWMLLNMLFWVLLGATWVPTSN